MATTENLSNRVAVVTGASRGIGRSIAEKILEQGGSVALVARDEDLLKEVARDQAHALSIPMDLCEEENIPVLLNTVMKHFGRVDLLVNNAAVMIPGKVEEMTPDDFRAVMETNVVAPFLMIREFLPILKKNTGGTIINVASLAPTAPNPGLGAYAASKAALISLSDALREEVREDGVRVSVILPGSTRTEIHQREITVDDDWMLAPEDVAEAVLAIYRSEPSALWSRVEIRPVRKKNRNHPPRR